MILILSLLFSSTTFSAVTFEEFQELKLAISSAFLELRPSESHSLTINMPTAGIDNFWWELNDVHASYSKSENEERIQHNIFIFGGYSRLDGMTLDGIANTACHEIGHGLGGAPYKNSGNTQEGQADYYATKVCLPVIFKYLRQTRENSTNPYIFDYCKENENYDYCLRAMTSLESNIFFFSYLNEIVRFEDRSPFVSAALDNSDYFYPSAQCRLDTLMAGISKEERPICWYPNI